MKRIYSKANPSVLLHIINRQTDITGTRVDLIPPTEALQVSCFSLPNGKTFRPHKHNECHKITTMTQESWIVVKGKIKAILYDLDDTIIAEEILEPGDCSITLYGGHNYLCLEEGTIVYEYKTGPYDATTDKSFINSQPSAT